MVGHFTDYLDSNVVCCLQFQLIIEIILPSEITILSPMIHVKGPYADHILIPPGSTGSSVFFGFK